MNSDIHSAYERLKPLGVAFRVEPQRVGPITAILFEETYGNRINLVQPPA